MKRRVILLGPPGSGKGTVAARLEKEFGLPHVSSGHLLRQEVAKNSPLGRQAKAFIENGRLAPDELVLELMRHWCEGADRAAGFMLDGFPRNILQAEVLDDWLAARGLAIEVVICLEAADDEIIHRVAGRRSCSQCGRVFHVTGLPPRQDGVCDECGGKLIQRADDSETILRERFEIYRRATWPLVGYYRRQGKLVSVDAMQPVDQRSAAAAQALQS